MVIVERKRLERAGELLKEIVDFIPSVIIGIDSARRIIQWNMQAEKLIEIGSDQVLGMRLKEVVPEFEASFRYIDEAIAECSTMNINNFLIRSDGEYKYYNIAISPVELDEGSGVVIRIDDATGNERKNAQLKHSQKMAMIGTLASGLAHDFSNILCGIVGTVSVMKQELSEDPIFYSKNFENYLDLIDKFGKRAVKTVNHLLSISKKKKLSTVQFDLNDSVRNVLLLCRNTFNKSVSITEEYSELPSFVIGDAAQIEHVILNSCINASHAMTIMKDNTDEWGGELSVSVNEYKPDRAFINSHPEAQNRNYKVVSIRDSGVGMSQEVFDEIISTFSD